MKCVIRKTPASITFLINYFKTGTMKVSSSIQAEEKKIKINYNNLKKKRSTELHLHSVNR